MVVVVEEVIGYLLILPVTLPRNVGLDVDPLTTRDTPSVMIGIHGPL